MMSARLLLSQVGPRQAVQACFRVKSHRFFSAQAMPFPDSEATPVQSKNYPDKIVNIVDQISGLTLLEVADLNELLKARLKITDAPVMMAGSFAAAPAAGAPAAEEEEEAAPAVAVQTSFSVKLESFDNAKKVTLIKEIKNLVEGMNLVQAKKFVESCPTVVKADLSKDEAEKLKEALTAAGATCKIE